MRTPEEIHAILAQYPQDWRRICSASMVTESDLPGLSARLGHPVTLQEARECACLGCIAVMGPSVGERPISVYEYYAWEQWHATHGDLLRGLASYYPMDESSGEPRRIK